MRSLIKRLVAAPTFPDSEQTRAARWLNFLVLTLIAVLVSDSLAILLGLLDQDALTSVLMANSAGLLTCTLVLLLMRRGSVTLAALLLLSVLFVLITYTNALIFQTIRTPNITTYFALIPLTGLLVGRRNMNLFAALCLLTIGAIFYLEWTHVLIPAPNTRSIVDDLVVLFLAITVTTTFLNASIRRVEEKADEIRRTAAALTTANQQLQASQLQLQQARTELEQKVEQRTHELQQSNRNLQAEVEERQRLVDALARSEANWRSLVEQLPEVIVRINHVQTITFINRGIGKRSSDALLGAPAATLHLQAKYQALLEQSIRTVFATGDTVSYESEEITNGSHTWQVNRVGAIRQNGMVRDVILISTDITEQKQTEAAMFQLQKLESLGVLAGGVAHDFNNLLAAILMQLSLAVKKLPTDHPAVNHIQRPIKAAQCAAELTRQMLNYAGRTSSETQPLDLNGLIMDNIHLFSASISKNVTLTVQLADTLPIIVGDKGQLQQLIMNLILNSADAISPKAGTITLVTNTERLTGAETHYWHWLGTPLAAGSYIKLDVYDTGCGIDAQTLPKIFDPFFTTKFTGRGLGLASLLGIVRAHKGGLHVSSTVGQGTVFSLVFPAGIVTSLLTEQPPVTATLTGVDAHLLIIDDEEMVRESMKDILTATGLHVFTAADGPTGIQLFLAHRQKLKLVLLDLSMPGMSGKEVFSELRRIDLQIPIVLVSGYSEPEVREHFISEGVNGFIQKPYTMDFLLQQVQSYLVAP